MRQSRLMRLVLMPLAALLLLAGAACEDETAGPEEGATTEEITGDEEVGVEEEVFANTEEFVGEQVTVSAEITEFLSTRAFRLSGEDFGGEPLLVVSANEPNAEAGAAVQVTGTVREFEITAFEEELGADLDDDALATFEGEHAIVAQSVEPIDTTEGDDNA